jgi:hypothetical protein
MQNKEERWMAINLKLDEFEKDVIEEIATLSGHSSGVVRDILESTFLGSVLVRYKGDEYISGTRVAHVECFFAASDLFKRLIGDIHDGESDLISQLLQKKIKSALQDILDKDN